MVSDIERRTETAKRILISKRNHRRVRDRALTRLARAHREEYLQLLEREKARDEEMGNRWTSIAGNSNAIESYKDSIEGAVDPNNEGANESYYGGEE